jgi:hypothetical protein
VWDALEASDWSSVRDDASVLFMTKILLMKMDIVNIHTTTTPRLSVKKTELPVNAVSPYPTNGAQIAPIALYNGMLFLVRIAGELWLVALVFIRSASSYETVLAYLKLRIILDS